MGSREFERYHQRFMSQVDQRQDFPEVGDEPQGSGQERATPRILSPELNQQYEMLRGLLQRSLFLAEKCVDFEASQILRTRLTNLQAAALLVIVGEVKVGKSSFINALVREEVCAVAPGPCTLGIQELVYGVERTAETLGHSWQRVYLPKEVLREITIVDTPGTNSIVQNHQTITENYIPQSDLVVFVFSAPNPHTKSAWELLTLIRKEWHRKMVFVLQQSDRASHHELTTNLAHVKRYARERQVENPTVFTLSAKREMEGLPESGFSEFRNFLQNAIAHGDVWQMKVEGSYQTIRAVMGRLLSQLRAEKDSIAEERVFYQGLLHNVEARQVKANQLKLFIIGNLSDAYDSFARELEDEFAEDLRLQNMFSRAIPFLRNYHSRARREQTAKIEIETEARRASKELFDEVQTLIVELTRTIARRQERMRENALLPQTADRLKTLEQLRSNLESVGVGDVSHIIRGKVTEISDIRKLAVAGSALAVLGLMIAALSRAQLFDITAGIFASIGLFQVAAALFWRRSRIVRDFRRKLGTSRKEFHDRLESEIRRTFDDLIAEVRKALNESVTRLDLQTTSLAASMEETFRIGEAACEMVMVSQHNLAAPPSN
jgi:GTPase SAR1 family protein